MVSVAFPNSLMESSNEHINMNQSSPMNSTIDESHEYIPLMPLHDDILRTSKGDYVETEKAYIDPALSESFQTVEQYSILDHLNYVPSERDQ